ncbi:hypothetical protein SAMN05444424_2599 [Bittarella massiliensis (ex Durand et al. 2017)]|uniref:Uncharacterized protein n=1 Tax=Bittarella massiliensis (ex Durand et al. 2017) TaxID=1720313 RepID=A0AAQ1MF56_9FIRM|nr:hypothetical protein HMPREF0262_01181 [Clostridium sp. ATCC 29733]SHG50738.1 hypothetical protein SAMN05444424_2599 [Bittarella massiliensis (ex Durand et al. 2017)]
MRWPRLVPPSVCKTHIVIYLEGELQEDGGVEELPPIDTACNYSEQSRQIVDAERRLIQLEATALLDGDIAPGKNIHGEAVVGEGEMAVRRRIYRAERARNPDGTVNYTKLELM